MKIANPANFWLRWVGANLVAVILAILAVLPVAVNLAYADAPPWRAGLVGGAVLGLALGLAQGWTLRRIFPSTGRWVLMTMVGAAIGLALGMQIAEWLPQPIAVKALERDSSFLASNTALATALTGAILGAALGGMQWLRLRTIFAHSGWWVIANLLGWALGLGLAALAVDTVGPIGWLLIAGTVNGVLTGWLLTRFVIVQE